MAREGEPDDKRGDEYAIICTNCCKTQVVRMIRNGVHSEVFQCPECKAVAKVIRKSGKTD